MPVWSAGGQHEMHVGVARDKERTREREREGETPNMISPTVLHIATAATTCRYPTIYCKCSGRNKMPTTFVKFKFRSPWVYKTLENDILIFVFWFYTSWLTFRSVNSIKGINGGFTSCLSAMSNETWFIDSGILFIFCNIEIILWNSFKWLVRWSKLQLVLRYLETIIYHKEYEIFRGLEQQVTRLLWVFIGFTKLVSPSCR